MNDYKTLFKLQITRSPASCEISARDKTSGVDLKFWNSFTNSETVLITLGPAYNDELTYKNVLV